MARHHMNNWSFFIAHRYFKSKKKKNFINILSMIAMIGVAIGTTALVIVPSIINGLESHIKSKFEITDPDFKIVLIKGKRFKDNDQIFYKIKSIKGIEHISKVLADNALLKYKKEQIPVQVKGVQNSFLEVTGIKEQVINGRFALYTKDSLPVAIIERSLQLKLGVSLDEIDGFLKLYYPKNIKAGTINVSNIYKKKSIYAGAVYSIAQKVSETSILVPISFARSLFDSKKELTAYEISLKEEADLEKVRNQLKDICGSAFKVLDQNQQHAGLIKAIAIEKVFLFFVFSFILFIASFNILFSLTMLVIEKKEDIKILMAIGANRKDIGKIFFIEGLIISFTGAIIGLMAGLLLIYLQDNYGLIGMGGEASMLPAYPVKLKVIDLLYTISSILVITTLAAIRPAYIASRINA